ncbi:chitin-binding protein [Streptomyces sp. LBUM 1478]|nr:MULTISPECIES: lytic polysaccharide monooxygenase [Streptomyces]MBP5870634.1 chitin-binding protein [Streptomyces sp. LBUM 1485]MBP5909973.1 chitin-binding protein [Streptomyces sp. LBUM 1478]MBP5879242.1 chitin-binding protein [Streptomyces sp. LBUM 1477]MBP5887066.1 chitin-binding protein [Streptomyces sp. LBUM 1487]MBP5903063.1 chitin-binding protein [Streptomyces sp. LBUM 1488]
MDRTYRMYRLSARRTGAHPAGAHRPGAHHDSAHRDSGRGDGGRRAAVATAAAVVVAPLLLTAGTATPARAHGAPTDPVSRVSACSPEGEAQGSAACRAAVAANGGPFTAWDNLRIAGVNGRDRQVVPDGQLCSGGLAPYKGLDLARADWPSTRLSPGGTLNLTYRSTIPHTGTFKLFLTKPGYDPTKPLAWSDLPEQPFASVTDPPLRDGSYRFSAKLPADRSGRHVLYTIWQNTSTVDTYYSCSDVVFPKTKRADSGTGGASSGETPAEREGAGAGEPASEKTPEPASAAPSGSTQAPPPDSGAGAPAADAGTPVASTTDESGTSVPLVAGGATALVVAVGAVLFLRGRRHRSRVDD